MSSFGKQRFVGAGLVAAADLTAAYGKAVKLTADRTINLAGAGESAIGILQNTPNTGEIAEIASIGGGAQAEAGAAISAAGTLLKVDANGDLIPVTADGDFVVARALEAAADGDLFAVEVLQMTHYVAP